MTGLESKYAYSYGRIRALEARLLERSRIERLLEAPNVDSLIKLLQETDYGGLLGGIRLPEEYERLLVLELERSYALVRETSPDPRIPELLLSRYDFHNMKLLLTRKFAGLKVEDEKGLVPFGWVGPERLRRGVLDEEPGLLPDWCREALEAAQSVYSETGRLALVDGTLDQKAYRFICEASTGGEYCFLAEITSLRADLTNIGILLRCRRAGWDESFLRYLLLPCGGLEVRRLVGLFGEPPEALIEAFGKADYAEVVEKGVKRFAIDGSLGYFELLSDNFILGRVKRAKYVAFGPEPLIGYAFAKENEVGILRNILVGKINGLPGEDIRERLRDVYI